VPAEHRAKYDILDMRIGVDSYSTLRTRRGSGYYKVPSLKDVWMRQVLEHNGSIWLETVKRREEGTHRLFENSLSHTVQRRRRQIVCSGVQRADNAIVDELAGRQGRFPQLAHPCSLSVTEG
jgi:hypothetical protein